MARHCTTGSFSYSFASSLSPFCWRRSLWVAAAVASSTDAWAPTLQLYTGSRRTESVARRRNVFGNTFFKPSKKMYSSPNTALGGHDIVTFYYLEEQIGSTQDEAKRLLSEHVKKDNINGDGDSSSSTPLLAVIASQQQNGRGTQGRTWEGTLGNVYLTVALPVDRIPVTLTLLPLQIGVLTAELIAKNMPQHPAENGDPTKVTVKWPNDVLVNGRKLAGVLIENWVDPERKMGASWLLIGIGVNVSAAPTLASGIRPAACLHDFQKQPLASAKEMGTQLALAVANWTSVTPRQISRAQLEKQVLQHWTTWAEFGQIYTIRDTGEDVLVLAVESDGRLRVQDANGQERLLVADYLH